MSVLAKRKISTYELTAQDKLINKNFISLLFQTIIYGTVAGSISIIVPLYALSIKANTVQVGLIAGSRGMGHFLLVVPIGILIDRFGIKKVFTISSFIEFIVVMNMFRANNPDLLLLFSLIEGLICSTRLTALNAWAFKLLPYLKASQTGWYKGSTSTGATILGPIIGTMLVEKQGFVLTFVFISALVLIANLIYCFFETEFINVVNETNQNKEGVIESVLKMVSMLKNKTLLLASYADSLNTVFNSCFRILIILLIVNIMHRASGSVSLVTLCVGTAYLVVVFVFGFILDRLSSKLIYILSAAMISFALLGIAFSTNFIVICLISVLAGSGLGVLSLVNYKIIGTIKEDSGKVSGIITFWSGIVMCMGPMVISCVTAMFGMNIGFLALIVPFLILILIVVLKDDLSKFLQLLILLILLYQLVVKTFK